MKPDQHESQNHPSEHDPNEQKDPHAGRPITGPILDELKPKKDKPEFTDPIAPPKAAELDQDAGGGYNLDHTIPQP